MWRLILMIMMVWPLVAQSPAALERQREAAERQRLRMAQRSVDEGVPAAVQRQAESVGRQREKAVPQGSGFFALPWPEPPALPPVVANMAGYFPCERLPDAELNPLLEQGAQAYALPAELLRAVVRRESGSYPCAVSRSGAMGLMQLMPGTASAMGVTNPFDPGENVRGGSQFLRQMLDRYGGNLPLALGAYNAGPGRVDRSGGVPAIPETQNYVRSIIEELTPALWGSGP